MNAPVVLPPHAASTALKLPVSHPPVRAKRIGILLVNLGTPDATTYWPMRRYLKEFLSDRRVIEVNRLLWWPLLNLVILSTRPFKSGKAYASIWNRERDESPLRTITRAQAEAMAERIVDSDDTLVVDWAMRYGTPSIEDRLRALQQQGCERILLYPLYPQYSATTTATVCDKTFDVFKKMRWQPTLRVTPAYHDDPVYIDALARSLEKHLATLDWEPEVVVASFHGLPKEYFDKGDPYHCHCAKTARLLRERLGWDAKKLRLTFQSRFGRAEWLQPYTDKTVEKLAKEDGIKRLAVITPGFVSDCVETLEEIADEVGEVFEENGGEHFTAVPCLNASPEGLDVIEHIVRRELSGWWPAS